MTLEFFDLATVPATPWRNGGGSTRELASWPPASAAAGGMDSFGWRVSVATIAAPGPFSAFAGVDRQIMLLDGDGVHLAGSGWQHTLAERWQPFAFSGDEVVDCAMLGGTSTDFNLMLRRGVCKGTLQVLRNEPPPAWAGLCMVLQGQWKVVQAEAATRVLTAGQGAWWMDAAPQRLQPVRDPGRADPVLAFVALERGAP